MRENTPGTYWSAAHSFTYHASLSLSQAADGKAVRELVGGRCRCGRGGGRYQAGDGRRRWPGGRGLFVALFDSQDIARRKQVFAQIGVEIGIVPANPFKH